MITTARQGRSSTELRSCAAVEVAVLGSPSLISLMIFVSNAETGAALAGLFRPHGSPPDTGQDMTKAYGPVTALAEGANGWYLDRDGCEGNIHPTSLPFPSASSRRVHPRTR